MKAQRLDSLRTGQQFTFPHSPLSFYVYRGNCWYGGIRSYDGGPWHDAPDTAVVPCDTLADQWEAHLDHIAEYGV